MSIKIVTYTKNIRIKLYHINNKQSTDLKYKQFKKSLKNKMCNQQGKLH